MIHYIPKTIVEYRGKLIKTACDLVVPKSEATTSRMSVECKDCLNIIQAAAKKGGSRG